MTCTGIHYTNHSCYQAYWPEKPENAAGDRSIQQETLQALVCHPNPEVRSELVWNPAYPAHLKDLMHQDPHPRVRTEVAAWTNDLEVLRHLLHDRNIGVRVEAYRNEMAPTTYLEAGAKDPRVEIRRAVANNPHSTIEALQNLVGETDKATITALSSHPNAPARFLQDAYVDELGAGTVERLFGQDETARSLALNWHGTVRELWEAVELTQK